MPKSKNTQLPKQKISEPSSTSASLKTPRRPKRDLTEFSLADIMEILNDPLDECGSGNSAVVYKGKWHSKEVAVKKYKHEDGDQAKNEKKALLDLGCYLNIIEPIGSCWDNEIYLVMKYVPYTLKGVLQASKLNWLQTLHILTQVAYAVRALSEEGYIIADINPDNILVDKDYSVYLCDFGSAKKVGEYLPTVNHSHTAREAIIGKGVSKKTDLFSFGVILLQMIMKCDVGTIAEDPIGKQLRLPPKRGGGKGKKKEKNSSNKEEEECHIAVTAARLVRSGEHVVHSSFIESGCDDEDAREISLLGRNCTLDRPDSRPEIDDIICKLERMKTKKGAMKLKISQMD